MTQSYLPILGGLQRIVYDLAQGLSAQGHAVQVVAQRHPRTLPEHETLDGVAVNRLFFVRSGWSHIRRGRFDQFGAGLFVGSHTDLQLRQLIRDFQPDVIHFHYPQHLTSFVLAARAHTSARLIVSFHGVEIDAAQQGTERDRQTLHYLLDAADCVTAVSRDALKRVIQFSPAVEEKTQIVPNGLRDEAFHIPEPYPYPRPYLFAAGRLVLPKGFQLLLDAFGRLASNAPGVDLLIAGDGEARSSLEALAKQLHLTDRVRFPGEVSPTEIAQLIRGSQFVVVPSLAETFGLIALETMALERKVIATRVGGLPELVEPPENQLVDPQAEAICAAIQHWLTEPSFTPASPVNRKRANQFTKGAMISRYEAIYRQNIRAAGIITG